MVAPNDLAFQTNGPDARSGFAICPVLRMDEGIKWRRFGPHCFAGLLLPVLFVAVIGLWFKDFQTPHESLGLMIALNLLLATLPALVTAYLFARSFLVTGAPGMALFSCGALIWSVSGLSPLAASLAPGPGFNLNAFVTIHNVSVWAASSCYLAGAALFQQRHRALLYPGQALAGVYALAAAMAAFIVFMALKEGTPVFFVRGKGGSEVSQFVLGSAIFTILLTLALLWGGPRPRRTPFLAWFALALLLLAIGYAGLMLQSGFGGGLSWVSRATLFLGGGYMLAAAYAAFRDADAPFGVLGPSRDNAPRRYGIAVALVLAAAVLRLVFLQALETHASFVAFYPAVMLAAFYGGLRAGTLATILSASLAGFFGIEPGGSFIAVYPPDDWLALPVFVIVSLLLSWFLERLEQAQSRLHRAEVERQAELERMVAERTAELSASRQREQGLIQSAMDAIIAIDDRQRIVLFNPAAEQMFGCPAREVLGSSIDRLIPVRFRPVHRDYVRAFGATGITSRQRGSPGLVWGLHQNGEEFPIEASISRLFTGGEGLFTVILRDISERMRHEEHTQLLMCEINHRAKNMLAVVESIARQTAAATPNDFIGRFGERIKALSASQDLLVQNEWKGVDITTLAQSQLSHFQELIGTRILLRGPVLLISAAAAQTIGMAVHELCTNAGKYGALSNGEGRVEVAWRLELGGGEQEAFEMSWREEGGPAVTAPAKRGFGSIVIQRLVRESLDAEVDLDFAATGLFWRLHCPVKEVMDGRRSLLPHDRPGSSFFDVAHAAIGPIRNPAPAAVRRQRPDGA